MATEEIAKALEENDFIDAAPSSVDVKQLDDPLQPESNNGGTNLLKNPIREKLREQLLEELVRKRKLENDALEKTKLEKGLSSVNEVIKTLGTIVAGVGGVLTGLAGLSFGVDKYNDATAAEKDKVNTIAEASSQNVAAEQNALVQSNRLQKALDEKNEELKSLQNKHDAMNTELATIKESLKIVNDVKLKKRIEDSIENLSTLMGYSEVDILANVPTASKVEPVSVEKGMDEMIAELFDDQSGVRKNAFQEIMVTYGDDPALIGGLIKYAEKDKKNLNGIYNTLVVLSHLDYSKLGDVNYDRIRSFAESVKDNGPKTEERAEKLLASLPGKKFQKPLSFEQIQAGKDYKIQRPIDGVISAPLYSGKPGLRLASRVGELPYETPFTVNSTYTTPMKGYNWLEITWNDNGVQKTNWLPWGANETPIVPIN